MPNQSFNPIQSVGGATICPPAKYDWGIEDVSSSDAGRTEDAVMHKMRVARKRKLELEWRNVNDSVAHEVLVAFSPEYVTCVCKDPLVGGFATKRFYSGGQKASSYNCSLGLWTITFNIIEQ